MCPCLTQPHVYVVRRGWGGEEQQVGIPGVEAAMQGLRNRLQVQVFDAPHLQPRLLSCTHKLLMRNHDGSERKTKIKYNEMKPEEGKEWIWRCRRPEGNGRKTQRDFNIFALQNFASSYFLSSASLRVS